MATAVLFYKQKILLLYCYYSTDRRYYYYIIIILQTEDILTPLFVSNQILELLQT